MINLRSALIIGLLVCGAAGAGGYYYYYQTHKLHLNELIDFEYDRDFADIHSIFERNWYWLMPYPQEEYDPQYLPTVFKEYAPQANPLKKGTLTIKVIRHEGHVIAFAAYHMKSKTSGFLLFVAVDNNYRGKSMAQHSSDTPWMP